MSATAYETVYTNRVALPPAPARYHFEDDQGQHAHFLGDSPLIGTSSVTKILAKPLTWWASGLAVQQFGCPDPKVITKLKNGKATKAEKAAHADALGLALDMIKNMDVEQYAALIDKAYRAHTVKLADSAQAGTDLHAELERFVKDHMSGSSKIFEISYEPKIQPFIDWTFKNVKRFLWSEGHTYSEKHWLGGISDVGYEAKEGEFGIIDFKSAKDAYPDHFFQIGGYNVSIDETGICDKDGNHIYTLEKPITKYAVVPFGAKVVEPKFYESPATARNVFLNLLEVYKAIPRDNY